jgi:hypothetical protein
MKNQGNNQEIRKKIKIKNLDLVKEMKIYLI